MLVTGHTGFLGGWVCAWLSELGATPVGFSRRMSNDVPGFAGDLRDASAVSAAVEQSGASVVLHLGAQALARRSAAERRSTYETNVLGTLNVLEAVTEADGVRACVVAGSSRAPAEPAVADTDTLDPYNTSKRAAEALVVSYGAAAASLGGSCRIALARPGVLIGGDDAASGRLVPSLTAALARGEDPVLDTPSAVRPWQHVLEAASGILWLAVCLSSGRGKPGAAYGFGLERPERALTVGRIAERLTAIWRGQTLPPRCDQAQPPPMSPAGSLNGYTLGCRHAREELGWRPAWTIDEALRATAEWFAAEPDRRADVRIRDQIRAYTSSARAGGITWAL